MPSRDDQQRSTADRTLPVRTRGDLQTVEVAFASAPAFIVYDPATGEAFHLTVEEYALVNALRRPASLRDLQRVLEERFKPRRATTVQLQQFVNRLYEQGLLQGENPGQGAKLLARGRRQQLRQRLSSCLQVLSVRVVGFPAGPLVERIYGKFGWLCSRPVLLAALAVMLWAACVAIARGPDLGAQWPQARALAAIEHWPLWIAAVVGVKALHEFGHALACRHAGARPGEMGLLLLGGLPTLYCDVSDSWRLASKRRRMAIAGAGMFVELVIAATSVIVWAYAEPGLLRTLAASLLVVCSVGTLLVNANPLLRYDGYYLLSDWWEVPNLAERARGLVSAAWRRWLLGEPRTDDPLLGPSKRRALWAYALLAKAYLAVVLAGLLALLVRLARPHGLENAVYTLAAVALLGMLLPPLQSALRLAASPAVRARFRWRRFSGALVALALLLVLAAMVPIKHRVSASIVLVPAQAHPLFAVAPGELEYGASRGAAVEAGDVVARLRNPELELTLAELQGAVREQRMRLDQLRTLQAEWPPAAHLLPTAGAELAAAEAALREQQAIVESLTIRAPASGTVLAPPDRTVDAPSAETLPSWRGSPLDKRNRGAWIEAGTALAVLAEGSGRVAWAAVDQADVPRVEPGQAVQLVTEQAPWEVFKGRVVNVARRAQPDRRGQVDGSIREVAGERRHHVVEVALGSEAAGLLSGARGAAKIETLNTTVGALLLQQTRRALQRVF